MTLKNKILLNLLGASMCTGVLIAVVSLFTASNSLEQQALAQLESLREVKRESVERYLETARDQISSLASNNTIVGAMSDLSESFRAYSDESQLKPSTVNAQRQALVTHYQSNFLPTLRSNDPGASVNAQGLVSPLSDTTVALQTAYIQANPHPVGEKHRLDQASEGTRYDQLHAQIHPFLRDYLERFGYYDIFLVDAASGDVVYSVFKEVDYATSLKRGPYANSGLAEAYRAGMTLGRNQPAAMLDFAPYLPSFNAPAGFIAAPVFNGGIKTGVLIFQFPIDNLNTIMAERAGLGESGETYLVGPDRLMRSDSYLDSEKHSVLASFLRPADGKVETAAVERALNGNTGVDTIIDYNGNPVLSAYMPLSVDGLNWVILAEIDQAEALAPVHRLRNTIVLLVLLCAAVIVPVALMISKSITRPLGSEPQQMAEIARTIAEGDLTQTFGDKAKATGAYASMMQMNEALRSIVGKIVNAAEQQAAASEELATVTAQTTATVEQQSHQTMQVATAINQMSATVHEVAQNVNSTADAAAAAREQVTTSSGAVMTASQSVEQMADDLIGAKEKIGQLQRSTDDIAGILETIKGIADQTNLLALNAAIEAARAGEQGRGFAVVADEVRSLARHTQEATEETASLINTLVNEAQETSLVMEQSVGQAQVITKDAAATAERLQQAVSSVEKIAEMATQVAAATEEQATVAEEISANISEINTISGETSNTIGQISASSEELAVLSTDLQQAVRHFKA